jgi:hypothetical protein
VLLIIINTNLHQSRAGIGSKLNTHKFILIIAQIIRINTIQFEIDFVIKSITQIGHETCFIASCLSVGVAGATIFLINVCIHLKVKDI